MSATNKTVLITGTSEGGIGAALVRAFQKKGLTVYAALRTPSKADELAKLPNVHLITLDVTSEQSVAAAAEFVKSHSEGKGLDILVNNCGVNYTMPVLDAPLSRCKEVFDVNLWGTLSMIQAFTPLLLQSKGMVVNISSVGGILNTPWIGIYAASKAALNIMSETLRLELSPFGIKVISVMTGTINSNIWENQGEFSLPENSLYAPVLSNIQDSATGKSSPKGQSADEYAAKVVGDVLNEANGYIYRGPMSSVCRIMAGFVPSFLVDSMVTSGRGIKELANYIASQGKTQ